MDSPPPSLDPRYRWSGSAAPSLPVAGCSSHPHGWGIPHRSLPVPASGSILPWAAGVGAPGTGVAVLDASLAPFPASGLLFPHFPHFPRLQQPSRPARSRQHGTGARSSILVCSGFHRALGPYLGHWWEGVASVLPSSLASAPVLPEKPVFAAIRPAGPRYTRSTSCHADQNAGWLGSFNRSLSSFHSSGPLTIPLLPGDYLAPPLSPPALAVHLRRRRCRQGKAV